MLGSGERLATHEITRGNFRILAKEHVSSILGETSERESLTSLNVMMYLTISKYLMETSWLTDNGINIS